MDNLDLMTSEMQKKPAGAKKERNLPNSDSLQTGMLRSVQDHFWNESDSIFESDNGLELRINNRPRLGAVITPASVANPIQMMAAAPEETNIGFFRSKLIEFMPSRSIGVQNGEEFQKVLAEIVKVHIDKAKVKRDGDMPVPTQYGRNRNSWFNRPNLLADIKKKFGENQRNVNLVVSKVVAGNTPGVSDPNMPSGINIIYIKYLNSDGTIVEPVIKAIESLNVPIQETINDIFYWLTREQATELIGIELTDSDIHTRGVGVCIVEYECEKKDEGTQVSTKVTKKIVIKPEDKSFEYAVYGNQSDSLANKFNLYLDQGILEDIKEEDKARIGTLDIKLSPNNTHGSAIEYREHKRFSEISTNDTALSAVNLKSVSALTAFSSLLGLGDLHDENAVYCMQDDEYWYQLLDAEVGGGYPIKEESQDTAPNGAKMAPLKTAVEWGEMKVSGSPSISDDMVSSNELLGGNIDMLIQFLIDMRERLRGYKTRIILMCTKDLFTARRAFFTAKVQGSVSNFRNDYCEALVTEIMSMENRGFDVSIKNDKQYADWAIEDFEKGKIPFFQLDLETGEVYQEKSGGSGSGRVVCKLEFEKYKGDSYLVAMIKNSIQVIRNSMRDVKKGMLGSGQNSEGVPLPDHQEPPAS